MTKSTSAEIISIGTEILLGELTDTNSVYIARVLRDLGIDVYRMLSVGDNRQRIADAIASSLTRCDIVITCGGLGPTVDDMTRQAVASATGRGLTFHQTLLDQIAERFAAFRVQMTDNNRQQAYLPDDAICIENPVGTAPAFVVEQNGRCVISLPGVPREMKFLMEHSVVPYLRQKYSLGTIKARILKAAGIGESALDELLGHDLLQRGNPTIGLAAHMGQIDIRITAKADDEAQADAMIATMEADVMARVGDFIFGTDDDTLEAVLVGLLRGQDARVTVVQAGIGDVLVGALSTVERGADCIVAPQIFTDPASLRADYGLVDDLSLRELARIVAQKACEATSAAAALVALSDPTVAEGADSEEATVIGVYTTAGYRDRVYGFGAQSDFARLWGKSWLLSTTWHALKESHHVG
ncbi:MAG: CinA family nicotinamide mononucleotide deamidase-related protein [Anaerolineaceae bacterium]|nr:MAG: CinA family nicotinamide mononucleotide deamidase-related protein [Anaerolineaceae bacterium]